MLRWVYEGSDLSLVVKMEGEGLVGYLFGRVEAWLLIEHREGGEGGEYYWRTQTPLISLLHTVAPALMKIPSHLMRSS